MELAAFMKLLKSHRCSLSRQQYLTLKGQALSGDVMAATKGLQKLLRRRATVC